MVHKVLFILFGWTILFSCNSKSGNEKKNKVVETKPDTSTQSVSPDLRGVHLYFNSVMGFISGRTDQSFAFKMDSVFFNAYCKSLDSNMQRIEGNRLFKLRDWYAGVLKSKSRNDSLPVFYPFSGGDFLHVHYLYPNSREYVMMAREPVGYLPDMDSLNLEDKNTLLKDVNYNMRDIFHKSYFITKNMILDLRRRKLVTGMILPIFWGLGVTGHEILNVQDASFDDSGKIVLKDIEKRHHRFSKGVRITFREKGKSMEKTVTYFSVDISDKGFAADSQMVRYLDAKPPYNSFLKAASYLPHYTTFSGIRNNILSKTVNHVQDDTGIPYKSFEPGTFHARVFGKYTKPVKDFGDGLFQKNLARAYSDSAIFGGLLDFSMGYHWATSEQNEMVFMRK
jgi:hypothetical protein